MGRTACTEPQCLYKGALYFSVSAGSLLTNFSLKVDWSPRNQTLSLTLRVERRLRVSENRVLRRIFGPKRNEVTGEWRKLHNEKLNDLLSSHYIVR